MDWIELEDWKAHVRQRLIVEAEQMAVFGQLIQESKAQHKDVLFYEMAADFSRPAVARVSQQRKHARRYKRRA